MERIWEAPWSTMESTHLISQSSRACDHAIAASKILACANGAAASTKWWTCRNLVYIYLYRALTIGCWAPTGLFRVRQVVYDRLWHLYIFLLTYPPPAMWGSLDFTLPPYLTTSLPPYFPTSLLPPYLPTYLPVTYMHPYIHTHTRIHEYRCSCRVCDHIKSWGPVASRIVGFAQHSRSSTICVTHETTAMFWRTNRLTRFIYGLWCFFLLSWRDHCNCWSTSGCKPQKFVAICWNMTWSVYLKSCHFWSFTLGCLACGTAPHRIASVSAQSTQLEKIF